MSEVVGKKCKKYLFSAPGREKGCPTAAFVLFVLTLFRVRDGFIRRGGFFSRFGERVDAYHADTDADGNDQIGNGGRGFNVDLMRI